MGTAFSSLLKDLDEKVIKKQVNGTTSIILLVSVFLIAFVVIIFAYGTLNSNAFSFQGLSFKIKHGPLQPSITADDIKKFSSETEFKDYLKNAESAQYSYVGLNYSIDTGLRQSAPPLPVAEATGKGGGAVQPDRVSETNVQVVGVDEPDILKTNGNEIYFSPGNEWVWRGPMILDKASSSITMPPYQESQIKIAKAFPPEELVLYSKIDTRGDLLLTNETLVVFSGQTIVGYNVADPKNPIKQWSLSLEDNSYVVGARLYQGKIYLITATGINSINPCPVVPMKIGENSVEIQCLDIYHPVYPVPVDITFVTMMVDPVSGSVDKKVSFVGSAGSSIVYVSQNSIYVTYQYQNSITKFYYNFLSQEAADLFPSDIIQKIKKLDSYDISEQSKIGELQIILNRYMNSLGADERMKQETEMSNRMTDYYNAHKRDLEKTGIIKIGLSDLNLNASGNVPGHLLNQFSLDEYEGNLRVATTVGETWGIFGTAGESANDIYVLDSNLKTKGKIEGLGLTERIYSARFIEDKGYLVTFRQTDPFYVVSLSNPASPELKGELKIPGYSSYLHPISKNLILGIGQENSKVKISLFDVSDPSNPAEKDKYTLDEYWTEVSSTHHAFLLDEKHSIFFMPASKGGYILSYANSSLKLEKTVSTISARRAIYINDYLYIVGDSNMIVLNESDWSKVNSLDL